MYLVGSKKAIVPILSIVLVLIIVAGSVVVLHDWLSSFQSELNSNVEANVPDFEYRTAIVGVIDNNVYFNNYLKDNLIVNNILINGETCNFENYNLSLGLNILNFSNCGENISSSIGTLELITNNNIFTHSVYFNSSLKIYYDDYVSEEYFLIEFISPTPENNSVLSNDNLYVNLSFDTNENISSIIDFDNSLVGWWRMDDYDSSYVYDEFGKHNCSIINSASYDENGALGGSFHIADPMYLDCGTVVMSGSAGTISAWVYANSFQTESPYISTIAGEEQYKDSAFLLRLGDSTLDNNKPQFVLSFSESQFKLAANSGIEANKWYNIVATYDGIKMAIYINGMLDSSVSRTGIFSANSNFYIGYGNDLRYFDGRYFNGLIDDVLVLNRGLSSEEVEKLYYHQSSSFGYNYTNLNSGIHTIKAYSQDIGGNVSQTEERIVEIS